MRCSTLDVIRKQADIAGGCGYKIPPSIFKLYTMRRVKIIRKMTFNEFWPTFLGQKKVVAKKTTIAAYTLQWEKHLSSVFGNINLNDVKNSTLQKIC